MDENIKDRIEVNEDEEISRPLSYYKELGIKPPALDRDETITASDTESKEYLPAVNEEAITDIAEEISNTDISAEQTADEAEEDDDAPSYPLSYYKESARKKAEAEQASAAPAAIQAEDETVAITDTTEAKADTEPIRPQINKQPLFPVRGGAFGVQGIAEAAVLAAIAIILGYVGYMLPVFSVIAPLFFPLPIALLTFRRGIASGICGTLVSGLLLALLLNPIYALLLIVQSGIVGLFFGYCLRKGKKPFFTLLVGTIIASLGYAASLVLSAFLSGFGLAELLAEFDEMIILYEDMLKEIGFFATLQAQGIDPELYMQQLTAFFKQLLPGILIITNMLMTFASYWLFGKILKPLGYDRRPLPPFSEWHMPIHLIWGLIIGGFLMFFGYTKDMEILYNIGTNILYIFTPLLMITAIAIIVNIGKSRHWSGLVYVMAVIMVLMLGSFGLIALLLIGMFDPIIDFRRRFSAVKTAD